MSEWQTKTLGEITDWFSGGTPSKQNESYWNGDIPWISAKTLNGTRVSDSELKITEEGLRNGSRLAQKGDLLLLVRGSGLFNSIPISIVERPVSFNQDIKAIRIKKEYNHISPWFLLYWLHGNKRILNGIMEETGIGAGKFDLGLLKELTIELPPKEELMEITQTFKSIDDKIILLTQQNKDLEELSQTLFKRWFVEFEFPNEKGEPYKSSGGKMIESELGEIPEGWECKELQKLVTVKRGGSPRPIQDFLVEKGLPWIKISDATGTDSPFLLKTKEFIKEKGLSKTVYLKKGSLILSNSATPGLPKFLELDACIHDGWLYFPEVSVVNQNYLYLLFLHLKRRIVQQGSGSVFTNLKTEILKEQLLTVASQNILNDFSKLNDKLFNKIRENAIEIQTLTQLRDTLLPKLMSGELRIH
jgi:type I restriction enzyme S subunit